MKPELWGLPADWTFLAAGSLAGIVVCWRIGARWGLSRSGFLLVQIFLTATGLLGSKLQSLVERDAFGPVAWELTSGFRYVGGIGAALLGLVLLLRLGVIRIDGLKVLDSLALSICAAMAIVRVGCFLEGCCFGTVTDGPLGVTFPAASPAWRGQVAHGLLRADAAHSLPVHPLQLYCSVWSAALFVVLWLLARRQVPSGAVLLVFLCTDGLARVPFEALRFEAVWLNAWVGLVCGSTAAALLIAYCWRLRSIRRV